MCIILIIEREAQLSCCQSHDHLYKTELAVLGWALSDQCDSACGSGPASQKNPVPAAVFLVFRGLLGQQNLAPLPLSKALHVIGIDMSPV